MRVALNQFYVTLASLCVTLASLWITLASLCVTLVSFWGQRGATGRSERSSGDQSEKRSQCKGGARRVRGGCEEGARRVRGGCREGHFVHLGCSLEIFWAYEGYFEVTSVCFLNSLFHPKF